MTESDRTAKWLAGDRLSNVLHLGDSVLAYQLCDQGHDVVVAGEDAVVVRTVEIQYVRTLGERLPFASSSFDVVVVPHLDEATSVLAEYARVLRTDGLLSTVTRKHDTSIPWVRKLREIVGSREPIQPTGHTLAASGLFAEPEVEEFASWEQLDLAGLLRFAHDTGDPSIGETETARVHALFADYGAQTGFLRLRHETTAIRARVIKDALEPEPAPPETTLFDFA